VFSVAVGLDAMYSSWPGSLSQAVTWLMVMSVGLVTMGL
jgi:hypothetical protein